MRGIYKITQITTGKVYIGQSINIDNRWNQHALAVDDLSFHGEYMRDPTDFTYQTLKQNDDYTKDDLDRLEKQYITDYKSNDPKFGFNGTAGNGKLTVKKNKTDMREVKMAIVKHIFANYIENRACNKKVLFIGTFKTLPEYLILKGCEVAILTDDYDYACDNAKIIRFDGKEQLMEKVKTIKKDEYDLIIANPPYALGNKIVAAFVDKASQSIVLMPIKYYKGKNLYKHILDLQTVDPKAFADAHISENLNIAQLLPRELAQEWFDVEKQTFDQKYIKFYEINNELNSYYTYISSHKKYNITTPQTHFMITMRTVQNGTHAPEGNAADILYNLHNDDSYIPMDTHYGSPSCAFIDLHSIEAKQHFNEFWYKNQLADNLIRGLHKVSGTAYLAIPHINWSKDRDYEHCALDDIMEWLDEDNK